MPLGTLIAAGLTAAGGTQMLGSSPAPAAVPPAAPPAPIKPGFPPLIPSTVGGAPPGNVLGSGSTPRTVESTASAPSSDGEALGPLGKINKFLGTEVGRLATGVASGVYSDYRRRRQTEKQFKYLEKKGLTPWEIGGGSSGGLASPSPTTLGTSPSATSGADRSIRERAQSVSEKKLKIHETISLAQWQIMEKQAEKIGLEIKIKEFEFDNFWQILGARMGPENLKMALAMHMNGLSLEQILLQLPMTPEQRQATEKAWRDIHNNDSIIFRNIAALGSMIGAPLRGPLKQNFKNIDVRKGRSSPFNPNRVPFKP